MYNAFVASIIFIDKQFAPATRQLRGVYGKPVILRGDETTACRQVGTGLVVPSIAIPTNTQTN